MTYSQMSELIYNLIKEVDWREAVLDHLQIDEHIHYVINTEMVEFGSKELGHHSWVIMNNMISSIPKRMRIQFGLSQGKAAKS